MAVPPEIRAVPRPKNTVVVKSGKPGPRQYAVRERVGVKYIPNGNPQPVNGRTIGHIVEGKFVPVEPRPEAPAVPETLSYGSSAFARSVSRDIEDDFLDLCPPKTAFQILSLSLMKAVRPSLPIARAAAFYRETFVSAFFPGIPLSRNTFTELVRRLGENEGLRRAFFARRTAAAENHPLVIDSVLKENSGRVRDLSALTWKKRTGGRDLSVVYAYDPESLEPVCAAVYPGSDRNASALCAFVRSCPFGRGVVVIDQGVPLSQIRRALEDKPELGLLTEIRRTDPKIRTNGLPALEGVLEDAAGPVACGKRSLRGGRFLFAFRDGGAAAEEHEAFLAKAQENQDFDAERFAAASPFFGVTLLESSLDLTPREAYLCWNSRPKMAMAFQFEIEEDTSRDRHQRDSFAIGMGFIRFIAAILGCRMVKKAAAAGLLDKMTFGELMEDLSEVRRRSDAPGEARSDDGFWARPVFPEDMESLEALGLSEPAPKETEERRKRGRPKVKPELAGPKRKPGRPKKADP